MRLKYFHKRGIQKTVLAQGFHQVYTGRLKKNVE